MSTVRREFPCLDIFCYGLCRHSFLIYFANNSKPWLPRCLHQNSWMMLDVPRNLVEHYRFWIGFDPLPNIHNLSYIYVYIHIHTYFALPHSHLSSHREALGFGAFHWRRGAQPHLDLQHHSEAGGYQMVWMVSTKKWSHGTPWNVQEWWLRWRSDGSTGSQLCFNKVLLVLFVFGIIAFKKWEGLHKSS